MGTQPDTWLAIGTFSLPGKSKSLGRVLERTQGHQGFH